MCIVSDGAFSGAQSTAIFASLLQSLVRSKQAHVTVLQLHDDSAQSHSELAAISGVHWTSLPPTKHKYDGSAAATASFRTLEWLRGASTYDHIVFHEADGVGHYPLLAKELGMALTASRVSVISLAPRAHTGAGVSVSDLEETYMRRQVVQRADALVAPRASIRFMRSHRWRLPHYYGAWDERGTRGGRTPSLRGEQRGEQRGNERGDERWNSSADGSAAELIAAAEGSLAAVDAAHRIPRRLLELWKHLPKPAKPTRAPKEAFSTHELVRQLSNLHEPANHSGELGSQPAPSFSIVTTSTTSATSATSTISSSNTSQAQPAAPSPSASLPLHHVPLVSVCVVHHERGPLLFQSLESIRQQDLPPALVQVVVVDDGSKSDAAVSTLTRLGYWPEMQEGRWLLLRRPSRYLGAARNEAARHATGRFLYFLDDDNCLKRHTLRTMLWAAAVSRAHVLTSVNEKWPSAQPPPEEDDPKTERWLPLGDATAVGMFKNCFGDASALVSRGTFWALGGFTEDGGVGHEDWELWARAVLRGYRLRVAPEALYWYRIGGKGSMLAKSLGGSRTAQAQRHANHARNIRPYLQQLAGWPDAQEVVRLAQGKMLEQADRDDAKP